jgi:hypothetical protein
VKRTMARVNQRKRRSSVGLLVLFGVICESTETPSAIASSIPTVNITDSGPDNYLPVGSAFYLAGTAEDGVTDVVPVFVRPGVRTMFGATGPSCTQFAASTGALAGTGGSSDTIIFSAPGEAVARSVWTPHAGLDLDTPVFIPSRWTAGGGSTAAPASASATPSASGSPPSSSGVTKGTPYQILVPQDPFFNSSGTYCLFVYKTKHESKKDATGIKDALLTYSAAARTCANAACVAAARSGFAKARDQAMALVSATSHTALITAANNLISTSETLRTIPTTAPSILNGMVAPSGVGVALPVSLPDSASAPYRSTALAAPPGAGAPARGRQPAAPSTDWLAVGVVRLLAEQGALLPRINGGHLDYYSSNGTIQVKYLRILADNDTIEIAADPASVDPTSRATAGLKASGLTIGAPDPSGKRVTLRDLQEMLQGNVRLSTGYVPAAAARDRLSQIMGASLDAPLAPNDQVDLDALRVWAYGLAHAIERLLAQGAIAPPATPQSPGEQALGGWLAPSLTPCSGAPLASWNVNPSVCGAPAPGGSPSWPGYNAAGDNPLEFLGSQIAAYELARTNWAANIANVTVTLDRVSTLRSAFQLNVQFTQSTWVFSYVTPVVGTAFVLDVNQTFARFYLGAQVHLVPNPVDSPQWTQPNDWLRAFALELGMSTTGGSLGPDGRFSGWKGLPPIFVGLALHAVPYTSFSVGGTLLERRSSTVAQEEPQTYVGLYLGLNVQANIPDLVVALKGRTTTTSTAPANP